MEKEREMRRRGTDKERGKSRRSGREKREREGKRGKGRKEEKGGGVEGVGEDSCVQRGDGAEKEGEGDTHTDQ